MRPPNKTKHENELLFVNWQLQNVTFYLWLFLHKRMRHEQLGPFSLRFPKNPGNTYSISLQFLSVCLSQVSESHSVLSFSLGMQYTLLTGVCIACLIYLSLIIVVKKFLPSWLMNFRETCVICQRNTVNVIGETLVLKEKKFKHKARILPALS